MIFWARSLGSLWSNSITYDKLCEFLLQRVDEVLWQRDTESVAGCV